MVIMDAFCFRWKTLRLVELKIEPVYCLRLERRVVFGCCIGDWSLWGRVGPPSLSLFRLPVIGHFPISLNSK